MASINPYLSFSNGQCEPAFDFYKSVFGNEFTNKTRFGDMPSDKPMSDDAKKEIMHVSLPIGNNDHLMGSDSPADFGPPVTAGNNFSISINADSDEEGRKLFDGLSAGGNMIMPLAEVPWGGTFGMFTDKFGINWMVSIGGK